MTDVSPGVALKATNSKLGYLAVPLAWSSILAGASAGVLGHSPAVWAAAAVLGAVSCLLAFAVLRRRGPAWLGLLAVSSAVALALAVFFMARGTPPFPMRSLHVGAVLSYGAVAVAAVLGLFPVLRGGRALSLAFSIALGLFVVDVFTPPVVVNKTEWHVNGLADPDVHFRYAPNSTATNFYPDDPRGYFERTNPFESTWQLETHEGAQAKVTHSGGTPDVMRVTIDKLVSDVRWHVKLQQFPFQLRANSHYVLRFRAKADMPRKIWATVAQNVEPWALLAPYDEVEVGTDWKNFESAFTAPASEDRARVFFDLGRVATAVEISSVTLSDDAGRQLTPPAAPVRYFIDYHFNSLGFRGPDHAIPAPPKTYRILALGDSYTLGVGVREPDTFEVQLEKLLNADASAQKGGLHYEVINSGISGYATKEERISYEKFSSAYAPQVVLIVMVFNDDIGFEDEEHAGLLPAEPGRVSNLLDGVKQLKQPGHVYSYQQSIAELMRLNEDVKMHGAKLGVVIFRNSEYFAPWQELLKEVTEGLRGTGIPILDVGPALFKQTTEMSRRVHAVVDGHPNEIAHRIAAEEMQKFLKANGLLPF